ncbi:MAG: hypothetical protein ACKV2U_14180 [Bryobacteraceae bacterium]
MEWPPLGMGNKLAQKLAAETDPVNVEAAICEEVRLALSELTKLELPSGK